MPRSGFIHTVHHGKRNKKETQKFIKKVKQNSDGLAPLFLSDGWKEYPCAILEQYSTWNEETQKREIAPNLNYAQVVKIKENGRLSAIEKRVIFGSEKEILRIIKEEGRGEQMNTSYVESRNGKYRKDNKRLTRKTMCHSKKVKVHDAHIDWMTGVYNFCREIPAFRVCFKKKGKRFEVRYKKRSPAMLEGMVPKILSLQEFLMLRIC